MGLPPVSQARARGAPAGAREPWSALRRSMPVSSRQAWEHRFPRHLRGGIRSADRIRWQRPRHAGPPTGYRPSSLRDEGPLTARLSRSPDGLARLTDEVRVASAPLKTSTNPFLRRGMATGRSNVPSAAPNEAPVARREPRPGIGGVPARSGPARLGTADSRVSNLPFRTQFQGRVSQRQPCSGGMGATGAGQRCSLAQWGIPRKSRRKPTSRSI